jgi:release factor glutamine methyltransferase
MGLRFLVDNRVFIPRPETELLVEIALDMVEKIKKEFVDLLDIGTGSGNVAVAIAKFCKKVNIDSVDCDADALDVAERNIRLHGLDRQVRAFKYDVLKEINDFPLRLYDVIVSNPPYIPLSEYLTLDPEVREYEPRHACTDGGDGLTFYKRITGLCHEKLRDGGHLLVEIGYGQSVPVSKIFSDAGFYNIVTWKDYGGIDRIIGGEKLKR